ERWFSDRARARQRPEHAALPRRPHCVPDPEWRRCREGCPVLVHVLGHDPETLPCREGRPTCSTRNGGLAARVAPCSCTTRKRSPAAKAALRASPVINPIARSSPRHRHLPHAPPSTYAPPPSPPPTAPATYTATQPLP